MSKLLWSKVRKWKSLASIYPFVVIWTELNSLMLEFDLKTHGPTMLENLLWCIRYPFGCHLDPAWKSDGPTGLPFHDKDGYSPFSALAGFALAQAAALTVVARSEEYKWLVLSIYGGSVFLIVVWIAAMLLATRRITPEGQRVPILVRAYDEPSIKYGRWVMIWNLIVTCVLVILAINDLLPNQTRQVHFAATEIKCDAFDFSIDWEPISSPLQKKMDRWIQELASKARAKSKEAFFLVKQMTAFQDFYKPFAVDVECNQTFYLGIRTAFVVTPSLVGYQPTYRQLAFRKMDNNKTSSDTLDVTDAKRGDYLLVLLFARDANEKVPANQPSAKTLAIKVKSHFPIADAPP